MFKFLIAVVISLALLGGCRKSETVVGGAAANDTIAPAAPQPAPTGTDAMTQTVELQDGRPEAEGGALTSTDPKVRATTETSVTTSTTTTTGTTATTTTR